MARSKARRVDAGGDFAERVVAQGEEAADLPLPERPGQIRGEAGRVDELDAVHAPEGSVLGGAQLSCVRALNERNPPVDDHADAPAVVHDDVDGQMLGDAGEQDVAAVSLRVGLAAGRLGPFDDAAEGGRPPRRAR